MTIKKRGKDGICSSEFYVEGKPYRFSFNGKKGMPLITSKGKAREKEVELKKQIRAGTFLQDGSLRNFGNFWQKDFLEYSKDNKSERGYEFDVYYGSFILSEFGQFRLSEISTKMVETFLRKMLNTQTKYERPFSPVTVRMIYTRLKQTFARAVVAHACSENPCEAVSKSLLDDLPVWTPRERWLNRYDPEEEDRLFDELEPQLADICRLLLNTGLRPPYEMLKARKCHVNLTERAVHYAFTDDDPQHLRGRHAIIPAGAILVAFGKDGTTRMVPLNSIARSLLEILCADLSTGPYLFTNRDGEQLQSVKKGFSAACARAKVDNLRPHDLRGTFATRLLDRGVPVPVISSLLGHSTSRGEYGRDSRITLGYAKATWEMMRWAVETLTGPPLFEADFQRQSGRSQAEEAQNATRGRSAQAS